MTKTKPALVVLAAHSNGISPRLLRTVELASDALEPHAHVRKLLETPVPAAHVVALTLRVASAADGHGTSVLV